MSLIKTIDPKQATGEVAEIFQQVQQQMGMVPNGLRVFGVSSHRLKQQVTELGYYMAHPSFSGQLTAAIRYIVARDHGCEYCVVVNRGLLSQAGWSEEILDGVVKAPDMAPLEAKDKAMLVAVIKAVRTPKDFSKEDVDGLRELGWTDQEVFEGVAHGAYSIAFDLMLSAFKVVPDQR